MTTSAISPMSLPGGARPVRMGFVRFALRRPLLLAALVVFGLIAVGVLFAPLLAPHDAYSSELVNRLKPPVWAGGTWTYPLGTDRQGRDVLSRLLIGGRWSLATAFLAVTFAGAIGVTLGLVAGYLRGFADWLISLLVNVKMAFPFIILALAVIAALGPSFQNLIIVLAFAGWTTYARVVRAQVMSLREREFITAARVIGAWTPRILFRHLLPNVADSILVLATLQVATFILVESFLSFIGLGIRPPNPSWGVMLNEGREAMLTNPWLATIPGLTIFFATLSVTIVGDGVRDYLAQDLGD